MLFRDVVGGRDHNVERRIRDRRITGSALDVSRLEHENLFRQVDEVLRRIARIELQLHHLDARLEALKDRSGAGSDTAGPLK
jgi:hypothetical protein